MLIVTAVRNPNSFTVSYFYTVSHVSVLLVSFYTNNLCCTKGTWGGVVVKALRYYSDGPGIDSRWCHWIFQ